MHKYRMLDPRTDYREGIYETKPHGVLLVKQIGFEGGREVCEAYGEFAVIDADMVECTPEEVAMVNSSVTS